MNGKHKNFIGMLVGVLAFIDLVFSVFCGGDNDDPYECGQSFCR